ncbi:potassium/proton antiporter [Lysobacter sp. HDW10]|uniref:potassium/proton antiporter n=1 Tax=Lysobacter sp. HDW10 TaxID=2714936 RepID=UPI00140E2D8E|nr:potassium/proton antiporter [Lysobacter sp. HDW10]QIK80844.1 potassium/proton antiporter [Lysobacter sp. HDW10]
MDALHHIDIRLLGYALLILAGVASSLLARRFGAPLLLVFLVIGMLLGVDGPGGIRFSDTRLTFLIGSVALCVILFDGGLRTRAEAVRGSVSPSILLATVGVLITAALTGVASHYLLDLSPLQSLLLGTVVASTDAAAVFFLIRAGGLHLEKRTGSTLELESGANDPIAIFLATAITVWISGSEAQSYLGLLWSIVRSIGAGVLFGYFGGRMIVGALNRYDLPSGLHPWLAIASALTLFALTNLIGGSGYLAVYIAGILVANRPVRARADVMSVQDAATWFAQLVMFLLLGLLATPHELLKILWPALGISAFLIFVARPVAVFVCLTPFKYRLGEMSFISWVGLRGAVGIFLASIPLLADLPNAWMYFNVAFVVVLTSLVVQAWTLPHAAHLFGVAVPRKDPDTRRVQLDLPGQLEFELLGYRVAQGCRALNPAHWPLNVRLLMVVRDGKIQSAEESGGVQVNDYAYLLAPSASAQRLDWMFVGKEVTDAEGSRFGELVLPGNVELGSLAEFYDLHIPARFRKFTAANLFAERFDDMPQIGDHLGIGPVTLTVRAMQDDRVSEVGLRLLTLGERLISGANA